MVVLAGTLNEEPRGCLMLVVVLVKRNVSISGVGDWLVK